MPSSFYIPFLPSSLLPPIYRDIHSSDTRMTRSPDQMPALLIEFSGEISEIRFLSATGRRFIERASSAQHNQQPLSNHAAHIYAPRHSDRPRRCRACWPLGQHLGHHATTHRILQRAKPTLCASPSIHSSNQSLTLAYHLTPHVERDRFNFHQFDHPTDVAHLYPCFVLHPHPDFECLWCE